MKRDDKPGRAGWERDPLWRMRHAIIGLALAVLLSIFIAAFVGRWISDLLDGGYEVASSVYLLLLAYVVGGTVVLVMRVAAQESKPLSVGRVLRWIVAIWLWPALFLVAKSSEAVNEKTPQ